MAQLCPGVGIVFEGGRVPDEGDGTIAASQPYER